MEKCLFYIGFSCDRMKMDELGKITQKYFANCTFIKNLAWYKNNDDNNNEEKEKKSK